ncbi:unnamed protein product [Blepharisma stoltei]|uniref:Uncharacterized protein n=1 Tax=Blepharisma stoltei TaxID=1481888 RepID=A0AAU9J2A4_9CILI|nr:unnamed protein product [Blepharisma stoltei]
MVQEAFSCLKYRSKLEVPASPLNKFLFWVIRSTNIFLKKKTIIYNYNSTKQTDFQKLKEAKLNEQIIFS